MKLDSSSLAFQRNLVLIRWYRIMIVGMAVPVTGLVPLWKSAGLSALEINLLQALFAATLFLWEVPSGYWADRTTRRAVLLWGSATLFIGSVAYAMAASFKQFLVAEVLIGIGFAFISGADEALLYDSLKELGRAKEFEKLWGRIRAYELGAGALAVAFGGVVCSYNVRTALWISVVYFAAQIVIAYRFVETPRAESKSDESHVKQVVAVARQCLIKEVNLRWLFIYSSSFFALLQPVVWWYQPYLVDGCGVSTAQLGFIWASFGIVAAYFAENAKRITARFSPIVAFGAVLGVTAISYLLLGVWQGAWSFIFILLHQASRGYSQVAVSAYLNGAIDSGFRATTISLLGMSNRIWYAAALIPVGFLGQAVGPMAGFVCLAACVAVVAIPLLLTIPDNFGIVADSADKIVKV